MANRSRVVFQLPTVGSSCPRDKEELVDGYSSAVARTTTTSGGSSERSVVDSEKRN